MTEIKQTENPVDQLLSTVQKRKKDLVFYVDDTQAQEAYKLLCSAMEGLEAALVVTEQVRQLFKVLPYRERPKKRKYNLTPEERERRTEMLKRYHAAKREAKGHSHA